MKKFSTTLISGLAIIVILALGAYIVKSLFTSKEAINMADVEINSPTSGNSVKIGSSQKALITALGSPKQITPYSSQASYKQGTVLNYNGAKFYFVHDKLTNFEITSHKFKVGLAGTRKYVTSIGNTPSDLPSLTIKDNTAFLDVKNQESITDQYLEYDLSGDGKVTKILYSDY